MPFAPREYDEQKQKQPAKGMFPSQYADAGEQHHVAATTTTTSTTTRQKPASETTHTAGKTQTGNAPIISANNTRIQPRQSTPAPIINNKKAASTSASTPKQNTQPVKSSYIIPEQDYVAKRDATYVKPVMDPNKFYVEYVGMGRINTPGTNLRDDHGTLIRALPYNTRVFVNHSAPGSRHVTLDDGTTGWVITTTVSVHPPDPDAVLHKIEKGEGAEAIVKKYYKDFNHWGMDMRFYENVLYYVNQPDGIYKGKGSGMTQDWLGNIGARENYSIWIPSQATAKAMHGVIPSGSLTYEWWNDVKLVAGFVVGLLHGALDSIIDIFKGLYELVKMILKILWSYITGQLISDAIDLIAQISKTDFGKIVDKETSDFARKWNASDGWDKGHFRGYVTGYAIMEVITIIFSIGAVEVIKYGGKFVKIAGALEKFAEVTKLTKATEAIRKTASKTVIEPLEKFFGKEQKVQKEIKEIPKTTPTPHEKPIASSGSMKNRSGDLDKAAHDARTHNPKPTHVEEEENLITEKGGQKGGWNKNLNKPLLPNTIYEVDGIKFKTDGFGRVEEVEVENMILKSRGRNPHQQGKSVDIKDGLSTDEGGHLIAQRFYGPGEQINYHAMDGVLNKGEWKEMENKWAKALKEGKQVTDVKIKAKFVGDSKRPIEFEVKYYINDQKFIRTFIN